MFGKELEYASAFIPNFNKFVLNFAFEWSYRNIRPQLATKNLHVTNKAPPVRLIWKLTGP